MGHDVSKTKLINSGANNPLNKITMANIAEIAGRYFDLTQSEIRQRIENCKKASQAEWEKEYAVSKEVYLQALRLLLK